MLIPIFGVMDGKSKGDFFQVLFDTQPVFKLADDLRLFGFSLMGI